MIAIKERPILFSTEMVKAILEDRKTQTRRVLKIRHKPINAVSSLSITGKVYSAGDLQRELKLTKNDKPNIPCPYGQAGDRLWVRETFWEQSGDVYHKADWNNELPVNMICDNGKWKPSIFMPRWASRLTLEITEIRVERLQDITEDDAITEGCLAENRKTWWQGYRKIQMGNLGDELMHQQSTGDNPPDWMIEPHRMLDRPDLEFYTSALFRFQGLWNSINGKKHPWDSNPWVWVISFRRIEA